MEDLEKYDQFEFILSKPQNTKIEMKGDRLIGELMDNIDFMNGWSIIIYPPYKELKTVIVIETLFSVVDSFLNTIDATTELMLNVYKYEENLEVEDIYGLFCYATIQNYMVLKNELIDQKIMHNDGIYNPPVVILTLNKVRESIITARKNAYGS